MKRTVIGLALLGTAVAVRADSFSVSNLKFSDVTIESIKGDTLYYRTASNSASQRKITDAVKIQIPDEKSFDEAEDAFDLGKWADAVDDYQKTLQSTTRPWLKGLVAARLYTCAQKSGRFDGQLAAWVWFVQNDLASADAYKPTLPADKSSAYLSAGLSQLETAAKTNKNADQVRAIRLFAIDIARAMGDKAKADELSAALLRSPQNPADETANAAVKGLVQDQFEVIRIAIEKMDFRASRQLLDQLKSSIFDPQQAANWLWLEAETREGLAAENGAAKKEAALAYMRLVANYPTDPNASRALLKTGQLLESMDDKLGALSVYDQVAQEYPKQPAAAAAAEDVRRLKAAGVK